MATMPGQNEQPKPSFQGNNPNAKPHESSKATVPEGHQPPGTQQAMGPGGQMHEYQPPEPKRRADEASGRQEPSANPERAPEHQPGYEAKHQKEAKGQKQHDDANKRSQADDHQAEIEANDELEAHHTQKANRTRPAARKGEVKRSKASKPRKHK